MTRICVSIFLSLAAVLSLVTLVQAQQATGEALQSNAATSPELVVAFIPPIELQAITANLDRVEALLAQPQPGSDDLANARFKLLSVDRQLTEAARAATAEAASKRDRLAVLQPAAEDTTGEGTTAALPLETASAERVQLEAEIAALSAWILRLSAAERRADVLSADLAIKRRADFLSAIFDQNRTLFDLQYWQSAIDGVPQTLRKLKAVTEFRARAAQSAFQLPWFLPALVGFALLSVTALWLSLTFVTREMRSVLELTNRLIHKPVVMAINRTLIIAFWIVLITTVFVWSFSGPLRLAAPFGQIIMSLGLAIAVILFAVAFVPLSGAVRRSHDNSPELARVSRSVRWTALVAHGGLGLFVAARLVTDTTLTNLATPLETQVLVGLPLLTGLGICLFIVTRHRLVSLVWIDSRSRLLRRLVLLVRWLCGTGAIVGLISLVLGFLSLGELLLERLSMLYLFMAMLWLIRRLLEKVIGVAPVTGGAAKAESDMPRSSFWLLFTSDGLLLLATIPFALWFLGYDFTDVGQWLLAARDGVPIGSVKLSLTDMAWGMAIFATVLFVVRALRRLVEGTILPQTGLEEDVRHSLLTLFGYVGIFVAALIGLSISGLDLSRFALVAGALSVGIGFGLQAIVSNFISGIIILFERPIKINDWVVTASGQGTVKRINIRSTEIETFEGASIIVPNSEFITNTVSNWTHRNKLGRVNVVVGVGYGSDLKQVEKLLLDVAMAHPKARSKPAPFAYLANFGESSVDFDVRVYLTNIGDGLSVRHELRHAMYDALNAAGIEIPFPQRDINIKGVLPTS